MSSNYWQTFVSAYTNFFGMSLIGLYTASQQGGGWASLDPATAGS